MIRVVIDTSVLVSAVISPTGPNAQLFEFIADKEIRPYLTEAVLSEYRQVFEYERLQYLDERRISRLRSALERASVKVKSRGRLNISGHEEDNRIYECAGRPKLTTSSPRTPKTFPNPTSSRRLALPASSSDCSRRTARLYAREENQGQHNGRGSPIEAMIYTGSYGSHPRGVQGPDRDKLIHERRDSGVLMRKLDSYVFLPSIPG